jgi:hypothetical protein
MEKERSKMYDKMRYQMIKLGVALALCTAFLLYVPLRTKAIANYTAPALKDLSQVKSEATTYNKAIAAIRGISSLKLEDPTQMKQALGIIDREASALKYNQSKLIVLGLSDSTFLAAVKKQAPDKKSATVLVNELNRDPKAVLKLDGAQPLITRLKQSNQADATTLTATATKLKGAADSFKKTGDIRNIQPQSERGEFKIIAAGYNEESAPTSLFPEPQLETGLYIAVIIAFYAMVAFGVAQIIDFKEQQDPVAECQAAVDRERNTCVAAARRQPFPFNLGAEALCDTIWLGKSATCLLL